MMPILDSPTTHANTPILNHPILQVGLLSARFGFIKYQIASFPLELFSNKLDEDVYFNYLYFVIKTYIELLSTTSRIFKVCKKVMKALKI